MYKNWGIAAFLYACAAPLFRAFGSLLAAGVRAAARPRADAASWESECQPRG